MVVESLEFGLTTTVAVVTLLEQQLFVAINEKVTVIGELVVLVKVPIIFPEPLAVIPVTVDVLFLVHVKVVFGVITTSSTYMFVASPPASP